MNRLHKISLFLLIWLLLTAFVYGLLVAVCWVGILVGLIHFIPTTAASIVAIIVGLLCAMIGMTTDGGDEE
ncbi:hypothetical protein [Listeria welshimeri]